MQRLKSVFLAPVLIMAGYLPIASEASIDLKSAGNFAVLAATTITNTGATVI